MYYLPSKNCFSSSKHNKNLQRKIQQILYSANHSPKFFGISCPKPWLEKKTKMKRKKRSNEIETKITKYETRAIH